MIFVSVPFLSSLVFSLPLGHHPPDFELELSGVCLQILAISGSSGGSLFIYFLSFFFLSSSFQTMLLVFLTFANCSDVPASSRRIHRGPKSGNFYHF